MENTVKELKEVIYQLEKKSEYLDERIGFIDKIEELESNVEELEEENKGLKSKIEELETMKELLLSRCARYEERLSDSQEEYED